MSSLRLNKEVIKELKDKLEEYSINDSCKEYLNHYHDGRFVQLATPIKNEDLHYEYISGDGCAELHFEGEFAECEFEEKRKSLKKLTEDNSSLSWDEWLEGKNCRCRLNKNISSVEDLAEAFAQLKKIFDKELRIFADRSMSTIDLQKIIKIPDLEKVTGGYLKIVKVEDVLFNNLVIPPYQRAYKWEPNHVNQLIDDLIYYKEKENYRLGTLVLNRGEQGVGLNIVDGQQRIITISLLLYYLLNNITNNKKDVHDNLRIFWNRTKFSNLESIAHIRENLEFIKSRKEDLDQDFFNFLLEKCEFVVIEIDDISEAFQFFDSQNARGRPLKPHDLLKAYHLREIKDITEKDKDNIKSWENQNEDELAELFLTLYRIKRWCKQKTARRFTSNDIHEFKGINLDGKRFPYTMQYVVCHYFTEQYLLDLARNVDKNEFTYPFQINQTCINGSRFFEMIRYYGNIFNKIKKNVDNYKTNNPKKHEYICAYEILSTLNSYSNRYRTGDIYIRQLFNAILLLYVDKFGFVEIDKAVRKIFCFAYVLRLEKYAVTLATIDNAAMVSELIQRIRDAVEPYAVINLPNYKIKDQRAKNADKEIEELYSKIIG